MGDDHDDDGQRLHRRQRGRGTGYITSAGREATGAVPGRATGTDGLPPAPASAVLQRSMYAVDGAITRVRAMLPQLGAALDAGSYLESGRLSIEIRTAVQRAEVGLLPFMQDPDHRDEVHIAIDRLHACARSAAPLLDRAPVLEAPGAASEAAQSAWETRAKQPGALAALSWDAEAQELSRAAGLSNVDVRNDGDARSLTDAHGARGVALGSTVYLHPDRTQPGTEEGRTVLAHELVHLAQSQLGSTESLSDHAAAEQEAAELAPRLARGATVAPRQRVDLAQPAADTGGAVAAQLAQAETLVASAARKLAVIQHKIHANEMNDRPSSSLAPELRAIGTLLATARTIVESTGMTPDPRWKQAQTLHARIESLTADVAQAEAEVTGTSATTGTSQVATMMGVDQPAPSTTFTRGPRTSGAMSGMQAEAYIRNTPQVHAAILAGTKGSQLAPGRVVHHDSFDSYAAAHRKMLEADGKPHDDVESEARSSARATQGVADPLRDLAHVHAPEADPDTTIHELMHVYTHKGAGAAGSLPAPMCEGAADYFTALVCTANGLAFNAGYPRACRAFKALVTEVGFGPVASMVFSGTPMVMERIELMGAGSWRKYTDLWRNEQFEEAATLVAGLAQKIAENERANATRSESDDPDVAKARADEAARDQASRSEDTWIPEGNLVRGTINNVKVKGHEAELTVQAGGKRGVRDGWRGAITLPDGGRIEGTVTKTTAKNSVLVIQLEVGLETLTSVTHAELRRDP